jgi:hypothetical protein
VRGEGLATGIEHHVSTLLALEEVTKVLLQVGLRHSYKLVNDGRLLDAELIEDDYVSPDREGIILEVL